MVEQLQFIARSLHLAAAVLDVLFNIIKYIKVAEGESLRRASTNLYEIVGALATPHLANLTGGFGVSKVVHLSVFIQQVIILHNLLRSL